MLKSSVRTVEALVMRVEEWAQVVITFLGCLIRMNKSYDDGTPCARKLACTVWSGGKAGDNIQGLPITITGYADRKKSGRIYTWTKRSCA